MKILIIAGNFPPDIGGPANYIPKLSSTLLQKGHQISVLCFSDVEKSEFDLKQKYSIRRISRKQNIIKREIRTIALGYQMAKQVDVIYSNGNDFKAMIIGTLAGRPRVHKIVGDVSWERAQNHGWFTGTLDEYQIASKSAFLRILDWVRAFPLRKAAAVITPSNYMKKVVAGWRINPAHIAMVYNAFLPLPETSGQFSLSKLKSSELIWMCTICRLTPWKGVEALLQVLVDFPNLGLLIVGDGPMESQLKQKAKDIQIEDQVIFAGRQPRENVRYFLNQSRFFILNSSYEGLPHVVLEAMSAQKLVLASEVGGTPELVRHHETGLLFQYNDLISIKSTITEALFNDHSAIIKNASHFIHHEFSFEKMINETEATLQRAITRR